MPKLFIPGPTNVDSDILAAQARPMIGHRGQVFTALMATVQPMLQQVLGTQFPVFISTSSGTGLQEAAVRNTVGRRLLSCICGAFGQRWYEVALANGLPADPLEAEWGQPNTPESVAKQLERGDYDTLAVVHNETSTGVENPVAEIVRAARRVNPDIVVLVDAVSSAGGVEIQTDAWGLDVILTSSQKCFALPPGLAFAAVSQRALDRAGMIKNRGWYFDFLQFEKYHQRNMTPSTPAISLIYALNAQLEKMLDEGLPARFQRHLQLAQRTRDWAEANFECFAAAGYRSKTVTTIVNTPAMDIGDVNRFLAERGMVLANGYGPLKNKTFRIGHMGQTTSPELEDLLTALDEYRRS
ncbi:MAG: alanine--glyoxylate aminotransferase family protein [Anaerolineales bacterium]|jgi:predicted phosphoserine aminotransferase